MNFQQYIDSLLDFAKDNPDTLTMKVVYSRDDEWNWFQEVEFDPTKWFFEDGEFIDIESYEDYQKDESDTNAVCIN